MKSGEKDKSDENQTLISKDIERKNVSLSHKFLLDPTLTLSVSYKTDSRGYKTSLQLTHKLKNWKASFTLCPESAKTDITVSRRVGAHNLEVGLSQNSVEVAYTRNQISIGAISGSQGITPMVKLSRNLGSHKISLACGYAWDRVDYYFNYTKGQMRIGLPFRLPMATIEGLSLSFFLLTSVYLISKLFPEPADRKARPKAFPNTLVFFAISGQSPQLLAGQGRDISPIFRVLIQEKVTEIAFDALVENGMIDKDEELRVDFRANGMDYCGWFTSGELIRLN